MQKLQPMNSMPLHLSGTRLRLISYNIQVGIASTRPHHYLLHSWKHLLPHSNHLKNLDQIASLLQGADIVGLQEVDAGSLRSEFVNQTEYLAGRANFAHWHFQTNRRIGQFAKHSNGLLSKYVPSKVEEHKLPGGLPGRGAIEVHYGDQNNTLVVVLLHLALGQRARRQQLDYVSEIVREYEHVIVMGDMNCQPHSVEMAVLLAKTGLISPARELKTFPSWRPTKKLDHILISPSFDVCNVRVLNFPFSDHLPISMDLIVPQAISLVA